MELYVVIIYGSKWTSLLHPAMAKIVVRTEFS